jgi:hypothetical protein
MGLHQSGKNNPKNIRREFQIFNFCQVVTFAPLWSHNFYIKKFNWRIPNWEVVAFKKTFQCHITCSNENSVELIFSYVLILVESQSIGLALIFILFITWTLNLKMGKPLGSVETHFLTLVKMCLNLGTFSWPIFPKIKVTINTT